MARQIAWALTLALSASPLAAAVPEQGPGRPQKTQAAGTDQKDKPQPAVSNSDRERWKWWLYDRAELGITDRQSTEINQIFESTLPALRESREELERADKELSKAIKESTADIATISLLVDRVESARSQNTKMRVLMLYRMHRLLSPDQRTRLEVVRARWEAARRNGQPDPPGHRRRP
jgi:Spy/CpxP family protein refolding chaperone